MTFMELCREAKDRAWSHVDVRGRDECWPWTGSLNTGGYGQIELREIDGKRSAHNAHRVIYALVKGNPVGRVVRHRCDYKACCNPRHLLIGTDADNVRDSVRRGRHARGEAHGHAVLDVDDVRLIRVLVEQGKWQAEVALLFGVRQQTVSQIARRRSWAHV